MIKSVKPIIAIVPAAGIGSRMKINQPKQYLTIHGKTIIEYAIASLLAHPAVNRVIVALNPNDDVFNTLPISSDPRIETVTGGKTRAQSVLSGLNAVSNDYDWVLVHDAARPCLIQSDLDELIKQGEIHKEGAILATPCCDTIKQAVVSESAISHTVDRSLLWRALTPQLFPRALLLSSLTQAIDENATVTDEASALEYCGYHPHLVAGRSDNIKVTHPEDLALARFYLSAHETEKGE